jgi:hypothetical protein
MESRQTAHAAIGADQKRGCCEVQGSGRPGWANFERTALKTFRNSAAAQENCDQEGKKDDCDQDYSGF